jgi:hypothetical protein
MKLLLREIEILLRFLLVISIQNIVVIYGVMRTSIIETIISMIF